MASVKGQIASEDCRIKTTSLHGCGWNRNVGDRAIGIFQLLIVEVEKQLVLDDRPAQRHAKIVKTLSGLGAFPVEVVSRIEGVILEILIGGTVKLIGSGNGLIDSRILVTTAATVGTAWRASSAGKQLHEVGPAVRRIDVRQICQL